MSDNNFEELSLQEIYFLNHALYCNFAVDIEHNKLFAVLVFEVALSLLTVFLQAGGKSNHFHFTEIWFKRYQIAPQFSTEVPCWDTIS